MTKLNRDIVIPKEIQSNVGSLQEPTIRLINAMVATIRKNNGGRITKDQIIKQDPSTQKVIDALIKGRGRASADGISPRNGQEFRKMKTDLRSAYHAKFSKSGATSLCWFSYKGKLYFMIDGHNPKPDHGRFVEYQKRVTSGLHADTGKGKGLSDTERERRLAALRNARR